MNTWIIILIIIIIIIVIIVIIIIIKRRNSTISAPAIAPSKDFTQHPYLTPDIIKTYTPCTPCTAKDKYAFAIYGANVNNVDKYNSKILKPKETVECNDTVFGGDPAYGTPKTCSMKDIPDTEIIPELTIKNNLPENYTLTVADKGTFTTTNPTYIAYGADGKYNTMYVPANATEACTVENFGDPISGIAKSCYAQVI